MPWFEGGYMIWMTLWLIGIGVIAALLWILYSSARSSPPPQESPEEILRRRYAAGEIDTEEYASRLAELRKTKHAA